MTGPSNNRPRPAAVEQGVLPPLPAPAGDIYVNWGTPQQSLADGFSAAQMDAHAREAWTRGLDAGMEHAPAADETTLPDLLRLLGAASKEGKAVKLSAEAAGVLYNAMTTGGAAQPADPDDMAANYDHSTHDKRMEVLKGLRAELEAQPVEVAGQVSQWRTFGEVPWFDGYPPHPSPTYEARTLYAAPQLAEQPSDDVALKAALKFSDHIINGMFEGGDWDGGDVQELAVKYGLLEPQTMQGPCNEDDACECAQNGAEFPSICYRKTYTAAMAQEKA